MPAGGESMSHALFFRCFWVTFIGLQLMLGFGAAATTGALLRRGDLGTGGMMLVVTLACALLCGVAQDGYRATAAGRPRRP